MGWLKRGLDKGFGLDVNTASPINTRIRKKTLVIQRELSAYLNRKLRKLGQEELYALLLLFCLGFGGYCLYLLLTAF